MAKRDGQKNISRGYLFKKKKEVCDKNYHLAFHFNTFSSAFFNIEFIENETKYATVILLFTFVQITYHGLNVLWGVNDLHWK